MAELVVGALSFGIALLKTASFDVEPVLDDSGKDFLYAKCSLRVGGIVNSVAIASGKAGADPVEGTAGNPMPVTLRSVRDQLMVPREYIKFSIGGQVVLESPGQDENGDYLASDMMGGPFPQAASFTHFSGTKSCYLNYSVVTYVSYSNTVLLSNRWRLRASSDRHGVTTRTMSGKAVFRKDYMDYLGAEFALDSTPYQADDFREFLFIPCDLTSRRVGIVVDQNEDGTEIDYTVTDMETRYGLLGNQDAVEITGTVTSGIDLDIKTAKGLFQALWSSAKQVAQMDPAGAIKTAIGDFMPTTRVLGVARATGMPNANQANLAQTALNILLDRFYPSAYNPSKLPGEEKGGVLCACYCTYNVDSDNAPFAEVRIEVLSYGTNILSVMFDFKKIGALMQTKRIFESIPAVGGGARTVFGSAIFTRPVFPASGNTRPVAADSTTANPSLLARLVAQTLRTASEAYDLPDGPPATQPAVDVTEPF